MHTTIQTPASRRRVLAWVTGATVLLVLLVGGSAANASLLGSTCTSGTETQPFMAWGDANLYEPLTGGSFQATTGWTLSGGAKIVTGGDPYTPAATPRSLELPAGASATSPAMCVNFNDPTLRFFDRLASSTPGNIKVTLLYNNLVLALLPPSAGAAAPATSWQPSPTMTTASTLGTLTSLFNARVSLRFTATGGPIQLDNIYIDPRCI